ncbi:hypothetical protein ACFQE5_22325 [Pseudonocardia hispaniensis]|uniref:Uncharacterized protein n=1 Tax=Pseudonocardia hispaniensis TaxID=904933 RepID=A0ABW1J957_9PSEU
MAAPAITSSTRYTSRGTTKFYWVAAIADPDAPTRLELDAGTDLSPQVADRSGWSVSSEMIQTPDLASRYTSTIPGTISAEDSSITFYMDKEGVDARALMPRDQAGFIVILDGGDVAANKMDVYPVTVTSHSKNREVGGGAADTLVISYAITSEPSENVPVPA